MQNGREDTLQKAVLDSRAETDGLQKGWSEEIC